MVDATALGNLIVGLGRWYSSGRKYSNSAKGTSAWISANPQS